MPTNLAMRPRPAGRPTTSTAERFLSSNEKAAFEWPKSGRPAGQPKGRLKTHIVVGQTLTFVSLSRARDAQRHFSKFDDSWPATCWRSGEKEKQRNKWRFVLARKGGAISSLPSGGELSNWRTICSGRKRFSLFLLQNRLTKNYPKILHSLAQS